MRRNRPTLKSSIVVPPDLRHVDASRSWLLEHEAPAGSPFAHADAPSVSRNVKEVNEHDLEVTCPQVKDGRSLPRLNVSEPDVRW